MMKAKLKKILNMILIMNFKILLIYSKIEISMEANINYQKKKKKLIKVKKMKKKKILKKLED